VAEEKKEEEKEEKEKKEKKEEPPTTTATPEKKRTGPDHYARAMALLGRGDERGALEAFRAYLRGSGQPAGRREEAERRLIELQRRFGEIEVSCDLDGAEVVVDGQSYGRTPLSRGIVLSGGRHELTVSKSGYNTVHKTFTVAPGQRLPFFLRLPR
jgi:hypothetical protein